MKQCIRCDEWKEDIEFAKHKGTKDRLQSWCILCVKIYNKKRYQNNSECIKENSKKWQRNNPDQLKENNKKWRDDNPTYIKEYGKSNAKHVLYKDRLTIDEDLKLSDDGISLEIKCKYCGRYFIPTVMQVRNKISSLHGMRSGEGGLYCSDGCKRSCPIYNQNKWPKGYKMSTSREVQPELRQLVLKRDDYICQKCGSEEELHCHHIWPLNESPTTSADIDECITLCKSCHKKAHKIPGCNYYELRCSINQELT